MPSCAALAMPSVSAWAAISGGRRPSIPASGAGALPKPANGLGRASAPTSGAGCDPIPRTQPPPSAIRPMICTATTFTMVAEGKIIA